jgi:ketol-acid reductoisomerase
MVKMYYDKDADKKILKGKVIAIMGYGSQGHAHANNLKESGYNVIVGETKGANRDKAVAARFTVTTAAEAAKKADIIMLLLPAEDFLFAAERTSVSLVLFSGRVCAGVFSHRCRYRYGTCLYYITHQRFHNRY